MQPSGYFGRPLEQKLDLKPEYNCLLINILTDYCAWFKNLNLNLKIVESETASELDFVHAFCRSYNELNTVIKSAKPLLKSTGMIWISWPKKSSKIPSEIDRESIRDFVLKEGLVDVKVASINDDWSALKFVYRLKDHKT